MASAATKPRPVLQVFLTVLTLFSSIAAFTFAFVFEKFLDQLNENFRGSLQSVNLPCIRSTLDECSNSDTDKCWSYCCPPASGYFCFRSPVVGLMCQDSTSQCGDTNWCRDFADIPETCATDVCKNHHMVMRTTTWAYVLASIGIFLDLVDIITMCTLPDAVVFKASVNMLSSLVKWLAFGVVIGAGTSEFMSELENARCFNSDGMQLVKDAAGLFISYAIMQVISAIFSMWLAPCSAYWGGRLNGVPYVK